MKCAPALSTFVICVAAACDASDDARTDATANTDAGNAGTRSSGGATAANGGASANGGSAGGAGRGAESGSGGVSNSGGSAASAGVGGGGSGNGGSSGSTAGDSGSGGVGNGDAGTEPFPLTISSNKRHFVGKDGAPFLVTGDSPWELIQNLNDADLDVYLSDRASRGFNAVLIELIEHKFTPHSPAWADAAGRVPFSDVNDFTTVNAAYFDHAYAVVAKAREHGILAFITPAYIGYGCGDEGWCQAMLANGVAKLTQYGQFVGDRFKDLPNVIWVEGGDHVPSTSGNPSELDVVNAVANGVIAGDGGTHLHTAHWDRGHSSSEGPAVPWLDIDATYTAASSTLSDTLDDYARDRGVRPSFLIEAYYEYEHSVTGATLRLQMYGSVLGGSTGFLFGSDPGWYLGVPNDGNPGWAFRDPAPLVSWKTALDSEGAHYVTRAKQILDARSWSTLSPDVAHAVMTAGYDAAILGVSDDHRLAVAYFSGSSGATIDFSTFAGAPTATWVDPVSGGTSAASGSPFATSGTAVLLPPGANSEGAADWVLELRVP